MRIFINVIACITLIIQFLVAGINVLIMQKLETVMEALYNDFIFISYFCFLPSYQSLKRVSILFMEIAKMKSL